MIAYALLWFRSFIYQRDTLYVVRLRNSFRKIFRTNSQSVKDYMILLNRPTADVTVHERKCDYF